MSNTPELLFIGDASTGLRYVPFAKAKIIALRSTGETMVSKVYEIDTTEIHIRITPQGDKIIITSPYPCPAVKFSGLLDTFRSTSKLSPLTLRRYVTQQLLEEDRNRSEADGAPLQPELMYGLRPLVPTSKSIVAEHSLEPPDNRMGDENDLYVQGVEHGQYSIFRKIQAVWIGIFQGKSDIDNPRYTNLLPIEKTNPINIDGDLTIAGSSFKEIYENLTPSKFTGLMRRIVQATLATDNWTVFKEPNAKAPVDYRFGNSFGCLKRDKRHYLIQITTDAIFHVPMKYCTHHIRDKNDKLQEVMVLASVDLKGRTKIGDIPSDIGSSWDNEIGWAFSYTDMEASIVYGDYTYIGSIRVRTTSLLTATFTVAIDGTLSATVINTKASPFWCNVRMDTYPGATSLFNIPTTDSLGTVVSKTLDFGIHGVNEDIPTYAADEIPVYVFYTEKGREVVTYSYKKIDAQSEIVAQADTGLSNGITDYLPRVNQPWYGTKGTSGYVYYSFSHGSSKVSKGGKADSYSEWTWYEYLGEYRAIGSYFGEQVGSWPTVDIRPPPPPPPDPPPPVTGTGTATVYRSSSRARRGRDIVTEIGGATQASHNLTLSTTDKECVLRTTITNTTLKSKTVSAVWYLLVWRGQQWQGAQFYSFSLMEEVTRRQDLDADCKYVPAGGVLILETPSSHDGYQSMVLNGDATLAIATRGSLFTSCGTVYQPLMSVTLQSAAVIPNTLTTTTTESSTTVEVIIFGHEDGIVRSTDFADVVFTVRSGIEGYAYAYAQGAFDPTNTVAFENNLGTKIIANTGNTEYDVIHKLFGWLGVA